MQSATLNADVIQRFSRIVAKSLHVDAARVTPDASLTDLGAESLDLIEISMEAESEFNIWISEKNILETAQEVFGPGVLHNNGVVTGEGKALLRHRMPELGADALAGELTIKDVTQSFTKVGTWVRMIEGLMEYTPKACPQCGGALAASVAFRMKCTQCGVETPLLSGEEINKKWVQAYYDEVYLPAHRAESPMESSAPVA